jgi:hypothetical protein
MTDHIIVTQNDTPTLTFTCVYEDTGLPIDLSTATLLLVCKTADLVTTLFTKLDATFGKSQAASGIVTVVLSATDTAVAADRAVGELQATIGSTVLTLSRFILTIRDDLA